jgi:hypothetical protein
VCWLSRRYYPIELKDSEEMVRKDMKAKLWNRREVLSDCARVAGGIALTGFIHGSIAEAQIPRPERLKDDRITFVTTKCGESLAEWYGLQTWV